MVKSCGHEPVLLNEVLSYLNPQPGDVVVDCTFGGGGHGLAILEKVKPNGKLIGIDWDPEVITDSQNDNLILVNDNYKNLKEIINRLQKDDSSINRVSGILLDLGLSSIQLDSQDRGFSFKSEGRIDLRFNPDDDRPTGEEILRKYSEKDLADILSEYGEEPLAGPIARQIVADRQKGKFIETTDMLVQLVSRVYRRKFKGFSRKNPATRTLQALEWQSMVN